MEVYTSQNVVSKWIHDEQNKSPIGEEQAKSWTLLNHQEPYKSNKKMATTHKRTLWVGLESPFSLKIPLRGCPPHLQIMRVENLPMTVFYVTQTLSCSRANQLESATRNETTHSQICGCNSKIRYCHRIFHCHSQSNFVQWKWQRCFK